MDISYIETAAKLGYWTVGTVCWALVGAVCIKELRK
jgi:hypothetical protein